MANLKKIAHRCGTCKWGNFVRTSGGKFRPGISGGCDVELPEIPILPWSVVKFDLPYKSAVLPSGGKNCRYWEDRRLP